MRVRDGLVPGVGAGTGRVIGGGSVGRIPEAINARTLLRSSVSLMGMIPAMVNLKERRKPWRSLGC
jgi:hypothetical protein